MTHKFKILLPWLTFWLLVWSLLTFRQQPKALIVALSLAIVGTGLIFMTEMAYSYRKEGLVKWGKVASWLKVHTVMGIAGPIIIIWHTGGSFRGFPGLLAAFTLVVLASGFVGRYLYRLVPRSIKGQVLSLKELEAAEEELDERMASLKEEDAVGAAARQLKSLERQRRRLKHRIEMLDTSKLLLSKWRSIHLVMTLALFGGIVVHVLSILYYGRAVI